MPDPTRQDTAVDTPMTASAREHARGLQLTAWRCIRSFILSPQGFLLAIIVLLSVVTAVRSEYFLTQANLENVGRQIAVLGILASGTTLLMLTGLIDLSIGVVSALVGLVATKLVLSAGVPFELAILLAVSLSVALSVAMGLTVALTRVSSFMLTLGVWTAVTGVDLLLQGEFPLVLPSDSKYTVLGQGALASVLPYSVIICLSLWVMVGAAMRWSTHIHRAQAVGSNEEAARLSGLRPGRLKVLIFGINGLIVGIAGVVLLSRIGSASFDSGQGLEIQAIAAVVIGGAGLEGGRASMFGSALGVILIGLISNTLNLQGIAGEWQYIIYGSIIVAAIIGREARSVKAR